MRALLNVAPTPEQLALFSRVQGGVEVIRGAAGSGKTTTALLKLRTLLTTFVNRKARQGRADPIRIAVLTYNRTLSGYVSELAASQFAPTGDIELRVSTFASWAIGPLGNPIMLSKQTLKAWVQELSAGFDFGLGFALDELEYVLGRFLPDDLDQYVSVPRVGRGGTPRMPGATRRRFLEEVVRPYLSRKEDAGLHDWNDLALALVATQHYSCDIVIVDETQDFSANQVRAIMNQLMEPHSVIFILDTVQRIYARGFNWREVGIVVRPDNSFRLSVNYRNTRQIARFASSVLTGMATDDDGTTPNFESAQRDGPVPEVLRGRFSAQVAYAIRKIRTIDLARESVALLHVGWDAYLLQALRAAHLDYVEITRQSEWPRGSENIAVSTLQSAKGLEFDHVFILGLTDDALPLGDGDEDERLISVRRLVAMGIGRAKLTATVGYKPGEESRVVTYFDPGTFAAVDV